MDNFNDDYMDDYEYREGNLYQNNESKKLYCIIDERNKKINLSKGNTVNTNFVVYTKISDIHSDDPNKYLCKESNSFYDNFSFYSEYDDYEDYLNSFKEKITNSILNNNIGDELKMGENITMEGNIYKNDSTGNLHLVVSDNIKDIYLDENSRYIIHRDLNYKNDCSYVVDDIDFFENEYTFFSTYENWANRVDELPNKMDTIEELESKRKHLNVREKILKENVIKLSNIINEIEIELDDLFPGYLYEN